MRRRRPGGAEGRGRWAEGRGRWGAEEEEEEEEEVVVCSQSGMQERTRGPPSSLARSPSLSWSQVAVEEEEEEEEEGLYLRGNFL